MPRHARCAADWPTVARATPATADAQKRCAHTARRAAIIGIDDSARLDYIERMSDTQISTEREAYRQKLISDLRQLKGEQLAERKVRQLGRINRLLADLGDDRFTEQEDAEIKLLAERAAKTKRDRDARA